MQSATPRVYAHLAWGDIGTACINSRSEKTPRKPKRRMEKGRHRERDTERARGRQIINGGELFIVGEEGIMHAHEEKYGEVHIQWYTCKKVESRHANTTQSD